eukprot:766583-Hanusia_phi.AAC.8
MSSAMAGLPWLQSSQGVPGCHEAPSDLASPARGISQHRRKPALRPGCPGYPEAPAVPAVPPAHEARQHHRKCARKMGACIANLPLNSIWSSESLPPPCSRKTRKS